MQIFNKQQRYPTEFVFTKLYLLKTTFNVLLILVTNQNETQQ